MIDTLQFIKPLLTFDSEDDFYYLQILQRKKENETLTSNSRVIRNYYIKNIKYLEDRYEEIKSLCNQFNARASLRLNKRSFRKVALKTLQNIANSMTNEEYSFISKSYDRACGQSHHDGNKKWIVDIDKVITEDEIDNIKNFINTCQPVGDKFLIQLPTKNGIHLITKPFNTSDFNLRYKDIDIHKDNPINLYIP